MNLLNEVINLSGKYSRTILFVGIYYIYIIVEPKGLPFNYVCIYVSSLTKTYSNIHLYPLIA